MKITKLTHSCLLADDGAKTALFDPGVYSSQSASRYLDKLDRLDYLVITHAHDDHLDAKFVAEVIRRFPKVALAANSEVRQQLGNLQLPAADEACVEFEAEHESLPSGAKPPMNTGWHFSRLSHPGDSHSFSETKEILALPYVAPWGSTGAAISLAKQLKPKFVVPVHDWHLRDEARAWYYRLLESTLKPAGITVVSQPESTLDI